MGERDNAVHMRVMIQPALRPRRDLARDRRRTVHGGQNADIIARADPAVVPLVAVKGRRGVKGRQGGGVARLDFLRVGRHRQVVRMNMIAGFNGAAGDANRLAVFQHGRAFVNGGEGDLVS